MAGVDVSEYAIEHALEDVKPFLTVASGDDLPYPDRSFDLVVSINSIHDTSDARISNAIRISPSDLATVLRGGSLK